MPMTMMTKRFHRMNLVENIGVKNPLLTNNSRGHNWVYSAHRPQCTVS